MTREERDAVEALIDFHYERPGENYLEWRERWDVVFYRKAGMLSPGKDDAIGDRTHEERRAAFRAWVDAERAERVAAVRALLAKPEPSKAGICGTCANIFLDGDVPTCLVYSFQWPKVEESI